MPYKKLENNKKYHREYGKLYRQRRMQAGLCHVCGKKIDNSVNKYRCNECRLKMHHYIKKKREKRRVNNQCMYCTEKSIMPENRRETLCEKHYFTKTSKEYFGNIKYWEELQNKFHKQKEICPFTKRKLILGENASIDHIKPKKKYPHLISDLDNMVWVDSKFNNMKGSMGLSQFIQFIKKILKNYYNYALDEVYGSNSDYKK